MACTDSTQEASHGELTYQFSPECNNEDDTRVLGSPVDNPRQLLAEPVVPCRDVVRFRCRTLGIVVHVVADIRSDENVVAQFLAVCSSSILAEKLGNAVSFSSPWCGKHRVFEWRKPVLMDQLQPSTNADKLSETPLAPTPLWRWRAFPSQVLS